jgi:AraC-like DNA-binding protein
MFRRMANSYPLIRSSLLSEFPALVGKLGGPLEDILEESGLSLEQIEQPTLLIPFEKQIRVLQVAARECRCETFALQLAQHQDIAVFGALSVLIMNCASVGQALQLLGKYLHYSVQGVELEIKATGDLGHFIINSPYDIAMASQQFWDHSLALAFAVMRMFCGQNWTPRCTHLRRPEPQDASHYGRYFRSPMAFESDFCGLVFARSVLQQPLNVSINSAPQQLQAYLRTSFEGNFLEQMRRVINSLLPTGDCTARTVAHCMGYSPRTLQRKLNAEQTSFQQQINQVRCELAISYLQEPQFSITDIGELLGFAELSVFSRSFKRWFGITPSQWRARKFA